MQRSAWAPILPVPVAAFVTLSAASSGIRIPAMSRSRKWFTSIIKPAPLDPDGLSNAQEGKVGVVTSYAVSKKYENSSRM